MTTFSTAIATAPAPFLYSRRVWPFTKGHPHGLALIKSKRLSSKDAQRMYVPFSPFYEDRSKHLSNTRFSQTDKLVAKGLKPLEKTPSGASSGDSNDNLRQTLYKGIDFTPPSSVQKEAQKGIDLRKRNEERKKLPKGDPNRLGSNDSLGGTDIGVARAVQLVAGKPVTPRAIRRMTGFFSRHNHEGSKNFGNDERPSAGYVAHLLWGGDSGEKWANEVLRQMIKAEKASKG